MEEESVLLSTVEIRPTDEDPAYSIIRKAIEKRRYYLELIPEYSCNVYIKGGLSILDAPKKILGQEVGDMNGNLDSTGRGIIYLSESESKWNVQRPNKYKGDHGFLQGERQRQRVQFQQRLRCQLRFLRKYHRL
ncbi:MAG: hypothetical protein IPG32_07240 [Saprospirales bacterium]|nr:hypothetical protein [Saprospirales bacterium]